MTLALWCLLVASFLPTLFAGLAKSKMKLANNSAPRDFKNNLEGWQQRAYWAELNSYESFPPFATAVLVAHIAGGAQDIMNILSTGYIFTRFAYGACYIFNQPMLRSIFWFGGVLCTIGLYFVATM